jgi:carbonic anhydrase
VAGNFATDEVIGSLEYGAAVLGAKMLVVLGHSGCGAVDSTIALVRGTATFPPEEFGKIRTVLEGIVPAVENVIGTVPDDQLLRRATEENVRLNVARLSTQGPILSRRFASGQLGIVGAYYDIETGVPKPV